MPAPAYLPSNTSEELFPATFGTEAITLAPFDATLTAQAFEPFAFTVEVASQFAASGLAPPFELLVAAPSGRVTVQELEEVPIALVVIPQEGGEHRVTLREIAHNRWWGGADLTVTGETDR